MTDRERAEALLSDLSGECRADVSLEMIKRLIAAVRRQQAEKDAALVRESGICEHARPALEAAILAQLGEAKP